MSCFGFCEPSLPLDKFQQSLIFAQLHDQVDIFSVLENLLDFDNVHMIESLVDLDLRLQLYFF